MSQYRRLFLIADPVRRHSAALQRAAALAEASGAALHIAVFIEPFASFPLLDNATRKQAHECLLNEYRQWLADETDLMRSKGIAVTTEVLWTNQVLQETLQHVAEIQPDLVIKDVQHEPLIKRAFVTPFDWHLLRECSIPVHLVGTLLNPLPVRVVAAVDPSHTENDDLNQQIIQMANALALQCDAELHLLYSYELPSSFLPGSGARNVMLHSVVEEQQELHKLAFLILADRYGVPAERRHFILGERVTALSDFVSQLQADVLVMGRVQRKGLSKMIGSTTEHILQKVPCSILAVRGQ